MTKSESFFARAVKRIPGGVNSPVRAYGAKAEPLLTGLQNALTYSREVMSKDHWSPGVNIINITVIIYILPIMQKNLHVLLMKGELDNGKIRRIL